MREMSELDCCFILNVDLDAPVSDVHLVLDVIKTFPEDKILIIKKGESDNFELDDNRTITLKHKKAPKRNLLKRYIVDYDYIKRVKKFIKNNGIKAKAYFIQSSPLAYFIVKYLKRKTNANVVYNAQDIFPDNIISSSLLKRIAFFPFSIISKRLFRMTDHTITISDDMRTTIIKKKVSSEKVSVIHNWAKEESIPLSKVSFKEKYNLVDKYVVLYAGNIGKFQNVKMIIDTAKSISNPNIIFAIQGDGFERANLVQYANQLKLNNVIFIPQAPLSTMPETYRAVDINLVTLKPSIYKTALPSKIAFCLNTSVPMIITIEAEASIREVLKNDEITSFVLPNDVVALKDAIMYQYNKDKNMTYYNNRDDIVKEYFNAIENPKKYNKIITKF